MEYEVFPVEGSRLPRAGGMSENIDDLGTQVAAAYRRADENGGRVVAAHNLVCDLGWGQDIKTVTERDSYTAHVLFLVLELPDGTQLFED